MQGFLGWTVAVFMGLGGMAAAQDIPMTFTPEASGDTPIAWTALPLDLADAEPVIAPEEVTGPWAIALPAGSWLIAGVGADGKSYETIALVQAGGDAQIAVPESAMADNAVWSCHGQPTCTHTDDHSGLTFTLPDGWAAETLVVVEKPDGSLPMGPTGGFFEMAPEGGAYWALNPVDWVKRETGPCHEIPLGLLCTYDETDIAADAFAVIAPSLSWKRP